MAPGTSTHNANSVGSVFIPGFSHEVVVEATSDKIHPSVEQWSTHAGDSFIPGTLIPSGSFVTIKIPEPVPVMQ